MVRYLTQKVLCELLERRFRQLRASMIRIRASRAQPDVNGGTANIRFLAGHEVMHFTQGPEDIFM